MAMSGGRDDGSPMMEINTTPLIDVMLVLLIMLIITIPPQTDAVKVDLPINNDQVQTVDPIKNTVIITAEGVTLWNGTPVNPVTLQAYLQQSLRLPVEPELHFQPAPDARYEVVDRTLAIIRRANVTKLGFIGNDQYRAAF